MKVLLIGSGSREHTIAWKLAQSPHLTKLFIAPGNPGTALCGENIPISVNNFHEIKSCVLSNEIDIVVVGPEEPLVNGLQDLFSKDEELQKVKFVGPSKKGAMLEGSKDFAKEFMNRYDIPTASHKTFYPENFTKAIDYLRTTKPPYVLKADGLAAGKGVVICDELEQAEKELKDMLKNLKFGKASNKVVIEKFLAGIELSFFVITDGKSYKILPEAKDYKKIGVGDTGLNTGGMGAVSPVPFADKDFMQKVEEKIVKPTLYGLNYEKIDYKGFIFIGLMNVEGEPYVIEYNVRLGDPETEVIIPRIKSDFLELLIAVADEKLETVNLEIDDRVAVTVMLVSKGYPGEYEKGKRINGLENVSGSIVFHAGTAMDANGCYVTNGGRVCAITSLDNTMQASLRKSFNNAKNISFDGKYYRNDIGKDLMQYC